ncbi:MAG: biotin/lipoyl-containing protein, partial [Candidatus Binatia bacterium]
MSVDVRIPTLGESVAEGVIVRWIKASGDMVAADEPLLELETDKASIEIPAERAGVLTILKAEGETVQVGDVVARIDPMAGTEKKTEPQGGVGREAGRAAGTRPGATADARLQVAPAPPSTPAPLPSEVLSPAVRRLVEEHGLDPRAIRATGRGGRLTKNDVLAHLAAATPEPTGETEASRSASAAPRPQLAAVPRRPPPVEAAGERRVPMTRLRQRIADTLTRLSRRQR